MSARNGNEFTGSGPGPQGGNNVYPFPFNGRLHFTDGTRFWVFNSQGQAEDVQLDLGAAGGVGNQPPAHVPEGPRPSNGPMPFGQGPLSTVNQGTAPQNMTHESERGHFGQPAQQQRAPVTTFAVGAPQGLSARGPANNNSMPRANFNGINGHNVPTGPSGRFAGNGRNGRNNPTWTNHSFNNNSPDFRHYVGVRNTMRSLFPDSPYIPHVYSQWAQQQEAATDIRAYLAVRRLNAESTSLTTAAAVRADRTIPHNSITPFMVFRNGAYTSYRPTNYGSVLAQPTIWTMGGPNVTTPAYNNSILPWQYAGWPDHREFKWEGDDRAGSNVGRFMPLPRQATNDSVAWHHRPHQLAYHFDEVNRIPTHEDIYYPPSEPDEDDAKHLLGEDLLKEIEEAGSYGKPRDP